MRIQMWRQSATRCHRPCTQCQITPYCNHLRPLSWPVANWFLQGTFLCVWQRGRCRQGGETVCYWDSVHLLVRIILVKEPFPLVHEIMAETKLPNAFLSFHSRSSWIPKKIIIIFYGLLRELFLTAFSITAFVSRAITQSFCHSSTVFPWK